MQFTQPQAKTIDVDQSLANAYRLMRTQKIHHLVVVEDGDLRGIVSDRDLFEKGYDLTMESFDGSLRVRDVMVAMRETVSRSSELRSARGIMRQYQVTAVPVMENGALVGVITQSDLMNVMSQLMDETDDHDAAEGYSKMLLSHPVVQSTMNTLAGIGI